MIVGNSLKILIFRRLGKNLLILNSIRYLLHLNLSVSLNSTRTVVTNKESSKLQTNVGNEHRRQIAPPEYRLIYPEFLPDPKIEWRNPIREKLERMDMMNRRVHVDIPEFYVGSIMAVTSSDPHAPGKVTRFVGK